MYAEAITELLQRRPFKPFEVRMSNGDVYQVRHPELAFVLKSELVIGDPDSERLAVCSMAQVADIETSQAAESCEKPSRYSFGGDVSSAAAPASLGSVDSADSAG